MIDTFHHYITFLVSGILHLSHKYAAFFDQFFLEFLVELNVTSTGCVAFCCVSCTRVVLCCVVICLLFVSLVF